MRFESKHKIGDLVVLDGIGMRVVGICFYSGYTRLVLDYICNGEMKTVEINEAILWMFEEGADK